MSANLSDDDLKRWAHEHLVYEAKMLAHTTKRLGESGLSRTEINVLVESFSIHARCLGDFLWGNRKPSHPEDAFAADFCEPGKWERERGDLPAALSEIDKRQRTGREIVHLTYHRLGIEPESKVWNCGPVLVEIASALQRFASLAIPKRLSNETRAAFADPLADFPRGGQLSVATGPYYGGTIPFEGFTAD